MKELKSSKLVMTLKQNFAPLCFLSLMLIAFEFLVSKQYIPSSLIPSPSQILISLTEQSKNFGNAFLQSFISSLFGFLLSAFSGFVLAILFSLIPFLSRALLPFASFFQTVPVVAIAPLFVIYFGFGFPTVLASSFFVSFFPVFASSLQGLNTIKLEHQYLFKIYRSSNWSRLLYLQVPASYPFYFSGLKISAGLAVVGSVAGEFVAGGGLGSIIDIGRTQQRVDIVFASLLLLSFLGLLLLGIVFIFNLGLCWWRPLLKP